MNLPVCRNLQVPPPLRFLKQDANASRSLSGEVSGKFRALVSGAKVKSVFPVKKKKTRKEGRKKEDPFFLRHELELGKLIRAGPFLVCLFFVVAELFDCCSGSAASFPQCTMA